jgi:chorismate dehydratase
LTQEISGAIVSELLPADMRLRLMAHHLDLALMPVAEMMNMSFGKIVGNCCIGCSGPVWSVRLVSTVPIDRIKTLSLDPASRSSVLLSELILRHFFDISPKKYKLDVRRPLDACKTDALVVIGDPALAFEPTDRWEYRFDLGELWKEKTGLPFVFAAWIGCSARVWNYPNIVKRLQSARDRGVAAVDTILDDKEAAAVAFPLPRERMKRYFSEAVHYEIGLQERQAIQSFFDLAVLHGFVKQRTVLEMID